MSLLETAKQKIKNSKLPSPFLLEKKEDKPNRDELIFDLLKDIDSKTSEMKKDHDDFKKDHEDYKKKNDERLKELSEKGRYDPLDDDALEKGDEALDDGEKDQRQKKSEIDLLKEKLEKLEMKSNRPPLGETVETQQQAQAKIQYKKAFQHFMRTGQEIFEGKSLQSLQQKAMRTNSDEDGGYVTLADEEENMLDKVLVQISDMRRICTVQKMSNQVHRRPHGVGGTNAGWVGETDDRPQTNTSKIKQLEFHAQELYANPAATQTFLDDASFNAEQFITDEVNEAFAEQEGASFIVGDGNNKPKGFLLGYTHVVKGFWSDSNASGLEYINSGDATGLGSEASNKLLDLIYMVKNGHRKQSIFTMNTSTIATVRKIVDSDGRYIWQTNNQAGQPSLLHGYGVEDLADMPEIADGAYSLAFGNFKRGYMILDRVGVRVLRDPYSAKPYIQFYTTKRVAGGIKNFEAIKLLRIAA